MSPRALFDDLITALMLLTRLPLPARLARQEAPELTRSVWAYPLVGTLVGLIGGGVLLLAGGLGVPHAVAAALALAATILATGAFHEDGLADVADGLGGGHDKAAKLAIMRDSRVGAYGAVAVVVTILVRWAALASLEPAAAALALVAAGAASRGVIVGLVKFLPPARADGMGVVAGNPPLAAVLVAWLLAGGIAAVALGTGDALAAIVAAALAGAAMGWLAWRQIAGYTGDVLGAGQQLAEIAVLVTLATAWRS